LCGLGHQEKEKLNKPTRNLVFDLSETKKEQNKTKQETKSRQRELFSFQC
jgi:hypothetical protein